MRDSTDLVRDEELLGNVRLREGMRADSQSEPAVIRTTGETGGTNGVSVTLALSSRPRWNPAQNGREEWELLTSPVCRFYNLSCELYSSWGPSTRSGSRFEVRKKREDKIGGLQSSDGEKVGERCGVVKRAAVGSFYVLPTGSCWGLSARRVNPRECEEGRKRVSSFEVEDEATTVQKSVIKRKKACLERTSLRG